MLQKHLLDFFKTLSAGEATISEELLDEFATKCRAALASRFSKEEERNPFRMSSLGRPLCQQHHELNGTEGEPAEITLPIKLLIGDLMEAALVACMKSAGIDIKEYGKDEQLSLDFDGQEVRGTPDILYGGKIWDIKTASPYSFTKKFSVGGFHEILADDAFGYIPQGYLYSEGSGYPFGGWIAINKVTGEVAVCETPIVDRAYRKEALAKVRSNVAYLREAKGKPVERCFDLVEETVGRGKNKKPTGNYHLDVACTYCKFKQACWGDRGLSHVAVPSSKAENPPKKWYVGDVK